MAEKKSLEEMSEEELRKELAFTRECLHDEEETFAFMFKGPKHMGAEQAQAMHDEHRDQLNEYRERIREIEELLRRQG